MKHKKIIDIDCLEELPFVLKEHGKSNVFLVTGKKSYTNSGIEARLIPLLKGYRYTRFIDYSVNPKIEEAIKGVEVYEQNNCDIIVAIGGGSAIDTAKLINVFVSNPTLDPKEIVRNGSIIKHVNINLIAIPTTSGTGSEATHFAVVYMDGKKYSLGHSDLLPSNAIVDPTLAHSMSAHLTACTGLDALCQSIESHWSVNATVESKKYAIAALELILPNIIGATNNPNDENRYALAEGAYWAGRAINISKTTAPHAFSYYLTSNFGIPHGHAVALWMPIFLKYNHSMIDGELKTYLNKYFDVDLSEGFKNLVNKLNLIDNIVVFIDENKVNIDDMFSSVNVERLGNNPVKVILEDIEKCFIKS